MSDWEGKEYHFNAEADSVAAAGLLSSGEIIKHRGGALVLRCPSCNSMQFAVAEIDGSDETPTIKTPISCACTRCSVEFRIRHGKAVRE